MSSDKIAIRACDVSKHYALYDRPSDRLKQSIFPRLRRALGASPKTYYRSYPALTNVSFDARRGETIGIIGRNGAGKSTLLQILSGTLQPTTGTISMNGRVSALLELGAGFSPDFTGRENVYLYATILGLERREIDDRFQEIVDFADIGEFLDQPVKTYSTGMYMRLAFAVAASIDPDILIVDEALAVGDIKFQAKCFRHLQKLVDRGTTILIVTHSVELVPRYCSRAILIESGRVQADGSPRDVVNAYLDLAFGTARDETHLAASDDPIADVRWEIGEFSQRPAYNPHEYRWGSRGAEIVDFMLSDESGTPTTWLQPGEPMLVAIWVRFHVDAAEPIYGLTIKTAEGITVFGDNSRDIAHQLPPPGARRGDVVRVVFRVDQLLGAGQYLLSVGVATTIDGEVVALDRRYDAIHLVVENSKSKSFGLATFKMAIEVHDQRLCA